MISIQKGILSIILFLALFYNSIFSQINTDYLANVRDRIKFIELTSSENLVIAEQAKILLKDLYVHRYHKLDYYPNLKDPVKAIQEIIDNIDHYTTAELEEAIYSIFVSQRDLHLNYIFPQPYAKYKSILPITFIRTSQHNERFHVRVNSVWEKKFEEIDPEMRIPKIGDRVLYYDNLPIQEAVKLQMKTAQGANEFGGFTRALAQMTFIPHSLHLVPLKDEVKITFQCYKTGENYDLTIPWIAQWKGAYFAANRSAGQQQKTKEKRITARDFLKSDDLFQIEFNDFITQNNLNSRGLYPENDSNEPKLKWGIIKNIYGEFGYLKLESFVPKFGVDFTLKEIIRIIHEEFGNTKGLIFDVRNNGGGYIELADKLSQLFIKNDVDVLKGRLLNTDLNRDIFNNSIFGTFSKPEWTEVINNAQGTGRIYSDLAPFTYKKDANKIGQVYFKPVAVLTNARSYSAADIFSCAMQDNGAALIYGEDPLTGAGGANVITHSLFNTIVGYPFVSLPIGHKMRVSWRQIMKFGKNEGVLIEDYGCKADIDVSLSLNDLVDSSKQQIKKITRSLFKQSYNYKSYARTDLNINGSYLPKKDLKTTLYTANTQYIDMYINDEYYTSIPVYAYHYEKAVTIEFPQNRPTGKIINLTLRGMRQFFGEKTTLWNLKREVTILDNKLVLDDKGFGIEFNKVDKIEPLTIVNKNTEASNGWNLSDGFLQVGFQGQPNPNYTINVNSDAILFLDLSATSVSELSFDLEYFTEKNYDFIEVFVTCENEKKKLFKGSGTRLMSTYKYDISEFSGKDNVIIHYLFTSDAVINAPGVRVSKISIK